MHSAEMSRRRFADRAKLFCLGRGTASVSPIISSCKMCLVRARVVHATHATGLGFDLGLVVMCQPM